MAVAAVSVLLTHILNISVVRIAVVAAAAARITLCCMCVCLCTHAAKPCSVLVLGNGSENAAAAAQDNERTGVLRRRRYRSVIQWEEEEEEVMCICRNRSIVYALCMGSQDSSRLSAASSFFGQNFIGLVPKSFTIMFLAVAYV